MVGHHFVGMAINHSITSSEIIWKVGNQRGQSLIFQQSFHSLGVKMSGFGKFDPPKFLEA
jgi:hypothetical protein